MTESLVLIKNVHAYMQTFSEKIPTRAIPTLQGMHDKMVQSSDRYALW